MYYPEGDLKVVSVTGDKTAEATGSTKILDYRGTSATVTMKFIPDDTDTYETVTFTVTIIWG